MSRLSYHQSAAPHDLILRLLHLSHHELEVLAFRDLGVERVSVFNHEVQLFVGRLMPAEHLAVDQAPVERELHSWSLLELLIGKEERGR